MKIKSCPFCGKDDEIKTSEEIKPLPMPHTEAYVCCNRCSIGTFFFSSLDKAIRHWNRRAKV